MPIAFRKDDKPSTRDIIRGYAEFVEVRIQSGWQPFLVTWMFRQIRAGGTARSAQMIAGIQHTYGVFATRVVRRPLRDVENLPVLVATIDHPVPKRRDPSAGATPRLSEVTVNNGQHAHGVLLVPPSTRLGDTPVPTHFETHQRDLYAHPDTSIARVDVRPIDRTPAYAVDYVFKSVQRGRVSLDEVIVLPRVRSELTPERRARR